MRLIAITVLVAGVAVLASAEPGTTVPKQAMLQKVDMPALDPNDPPAVMLYARPGMEPPPPPPKPGEPASMAPEFEFNRILVAAWVDGRVVWSHDLRRGGSPYFTGKIDRQKVLDVYRVLEEETSGTELELTSYTIPDARSLVIAILSRDGETGISWQSSHPGFEDNKKLIYSSLGVSSAESFNENAPLTEDEIAFRNFRRNFDHMKATILALPPAKKMKFQ